MKKDTYKLEDQITFDAILELPPEEKVETCQTKPKRTNEIMFNDSGKPITMANGYSSADIEELERIQRGEDEENSI